MCKKEKNMHLANKKLYTDIVGRFYIDSKGYPVYVEKFNQR